MRPLGLLGVAVGREVIEIGLIRLKRLLVMAHLVIYFPEAKICRCIIRICPNRFAKAAKRAPVSLLSKIKISNIHGLLRRWRNIAVAAGRYKTPVMLAAKCQPADHERTGKNERACPIHAKILLRLASNVNAAIRLVVR